MCLLKGHNSSYLIYIKGAYWPKMCLLNKNVSIDQKCAYLMKIFILKSYNLLSINIGSYSFGNFFSFIPDEFQGKKKEIIFIY